MILTAIFILLIVADIFLFRKVEVISDEMEAFRKYILGVPEETEDNHD